MKGIILAGGSGSRLYPMTKVITKQLQPIYDKPMIYYPLSTLMLSGIREILLISTEHDRPHFENLLGNGNNFGINIQYKIQNNPNGIAEAFILGSDFIGAEDVALILGDNLFYGDFDVFRKAILNHRENRTTGPLATIFGYLVSNPEEFGVVEFDKKTQKVISLEEKPKSPKSSYAVPGFYLFDSSITERVRNQKPSNRGELEITDAIKSYLNDSLTVEILGRGIAWLDTGTPKSLFEASSFISTIEQRQGFKVACLEEIALRMNYISSQEFRTLLEQYPNGPYKNILKGFGMNLDKSKKAPIVLFVYNRPEHTQTTIEALKQNAESNESDLIIFSDGPKKDQDIPIIKKLRTYLRSIHGFKSIKIIEQEKNLGLANSIIAGVTEVISSFEKAIVMEDDLVTSRYFLKYMNEALEFYKNNDRVISIHGYCYPVTEKLPETFFLRGADCWGWATWKRGWDLFEKDGSKLLREIKNQDLSFEFDRKGSYPFTKMLTDQVSGKVGSWAIRWHASAFLQNKLTLYPGKSLVKNIGLDNSGTNCSKENSFEGYLVEQPIQLKEILIEESDFAKKSYINFERNLMKKDPIKTILKGIRNLLVP